MYISKAGKAIQAIKNLCVSVRLTGQLSCLSSLIVLCFIKAAKKNLAITRYVLFNTKENIPNSWYFPLVITSVLMLLIKSLTDPESGCSLYEYINTHKNAN